MIQWEYKVIRLRPKKCDDLEEMLNQLGAGGWEAVGLDSSQSDFLYRTSVILKRPKG